MKKKTIIVVVAAFFLVNCFYITLIFSLRSKNEILFTSDINNYNTDEYRVPNSVFPDQIPSDAEVVYFSYYKYWDEAKDIYLELKFNTSEEMENYLQNVKLECIEAYKEANNREFSKYFIETDNIYNQSYQEMFSTSFISNQNRKDYTGYKILKTDAQAPRIECHFGVISYSFDELTVIHTFARGWFRDDVHRHIPEYFQRFKVPLQENHQQVFYLEESEFEE